jgi:hypothetical protein
LMTPEKDRRKKSAMQIVLIGGCERAGRQGACETEQGASE